ncbi:MAG: HDIG domain-containing metalloprotein [Intestinibacillus sp.]
MPLQKAFLETEECILSGEKPSQGLQVLAEQPWFGAFPFSMLLEQQKTEQSPVHHPEGNVWVHTLLVVDEAAKRKQYSTDPREFMWAALLHDIGKPQTTKVRKGRITAYDHDRKGAELAHAFLSALTGEEDFIKRVVWLVRYHMQILYVAKSLPFMDIEGMKAHTDIRDVALLGYCDRLGRTGVDAAAERRAVTVFLQKCRETTDLPWLASQ